MRKFRATCEETPRVDIRALTRRGLIHGAARQLYFEGEPAPVFVTRTPCGFGGSRPWFICPQCGKRVAVLFRTKAGVGCRECSGLYYETQKVSGSMKSLVRLRRMRSALGATSLSVLDPYPPKPRGMWWRTYLKRWRKYQEAERRHCEVMLANMPGGYSTRRPRADF